MTTKLNPSYNATVNAKEEQFSLAVHAPELPPPSETFQYALYYLMTDQCFYRCVKIDDVWTWDKVTYGIWRNYVLPVTWLGTDYLFDDEVNTIKALIKAFKSYGVVFADMDGGDNVTLNTAINKTNEIIKHINRVVYDAYVSNIAYVSTGITTSGSGAGTSCPELGTKLNEIITLVNPHAGGKVEVNKLMKFAQVCKNMTLTASSSTEEVRAALLSLKTAATSILG